MVSVSTLKYVAVCVLTGVISVVEYLQTQNYTLSEATIGGAVVLVAGLAIHDLEGSSAPATPAPAA